MNTEERGVRIDQFMTGAKWMLSLLGILEVFIVVITIGTVSDTRKQTLDAITDLRKQVEVIRSENHWSQQDRAELHQSLGEIREAVKRTEGKK